MFGKFKEKLKGWFKSSSEKIEEKSDYEKEISKVERMIEDGKVSSDIPVKFDEYHRIIIPDLEKVKEEAEKIKAEVNEAKKNQKEIKKFNEELDRVNLEIEKEKLIQDNKEDKSLFSKIKSSFSYKITEEDFSEIFEDLELLLLDNNVAFDAVDKIKGILKKKLIGKEFKKSDLEKEIKNELRSAINEILIEPDNPLDFIKSAEKPFKILFFGINGAGKTTSIAKIASYLKKSGFSIVLAAGDTFRAASIEQISIHGDSLKIPVIKHDYGSDPAAVGYDAIKYAKKNKIDVVLIDSAGRMHTKTNLLAEMEKIVRVTEPDLKLFVAESVAGNDAVEQAKAFHQIVDIDGSILTKADVDDKGGTVMSISYATGKPVFYLCTGQKYEDLELFNKEKFIQKLGL